MSTAVSRAIAIHLETWDSRWVPLAAQHCALCLPCGAAFERYLAGWVSASHARGPSSHLGCDFCGGPLTREAGLLQLESRGPWRSRAVAAQLFRLCLACTARTRLVLHSSIHPRAPWQLRNPLPLAATSPVYSAGLQPTDLQALDRAFPDHISLPFEAVSHLATADPTAVFLGSGSGWGLTGLASEIPGSWQCRAIPVLGVAEAQQLASLTAFGIPCFETSPLSLWSARAAVHVVLAGPRKGSPFCAIGGCWDLLARARQHTDVFELAWLMRFVSRCTDTVRIHDDRTVGLHVHGVHSEVEALRRRLAFLLAGLTEGFAVVAASWKGAAAA